jgi:hypothetical protein
MDVWFLKFLIRLKNVCQECHSIIFVVLKWRTQMAYNGFWLKEVRKLLAQNCLNR